MLHYLHRILPAHKCHRNIISFDDVRSKLKDSTPKPTLTLLPNTKILEVKPMKRIISCEYNFDNCCVELKFTNGSMIAINTIAVENEVARNMYDRSELDYLIYNAPLEYADLILNGDPKAYLKAVTEYQPLYQRFTPLPIGEG